MSARPSLLRRFSGQVARLRHRQDGSATIEFVFMVPLLLTVFIMAIEAGVLQMRQVMLDRALDITIRDLRLGRLGPSPTQETVRERLCENAFLIPNCMANLSLELTPINLQTWTVPETAVQCVDREESIAPVNAFTEAGQLRPTLVRGCLIVDLIFPTSAFGLNLATDAQGGFEMVALSFYINEPEG